MGEERVSYLGSGFLDISMKFVGYWIPFFDLTYINLSNEQEV